ncbi:hypothetical protein EI77_01160 [Prosthecobacter fusiformis]|uniref:Uncharacterized protein n=1 Tax=Prosthecobacter fusiformis TaxID=48464 RepID=A0A4R7SU83_9BACT|nr:hypothetical protein [Prosthecobacter fusiformis]TDU81848.1 hypothetical protein EI77_01160 [Prosthecobacter fusiformis]
MLPFSLSRWTFIGLLLVALPQCTSLPRPGTSSPAEATSDKEARSVLELSAKTSGQAWQRHQAVEVGYRGQWSRLSPKIQPVLVDEGFRHGSVEIYQPRKKRVSQTHRGPAGLKTVLRQGREPAVVSYNSQKSDDPESISAASLVADAYTLFLFGSSWLLENADDFSQLGARTVEGDRCDLIQCEIHPGLGDSEADFVIAWVSQKSGKLRRVQFSLNGLDSTRGADADVTFHDFITASDGSVWPTRFVEYVRRPFVFKAHEWQLTDLKLEGQKVR